MSEGTNVGSVFLDLVVRDTVDKQVQTIAGKAQATTQKSFVGMEQAIAAAVEKAVAKATKAATSAASSASRAAAQAVDAAQKAAQAAASSATSCGQQAEDAIGQSFSKSVAIAQSKVAQLEKAFDAVTYKLDGQWYSGAFDPASKATQQLLAQQEKLMAQLEVAQDRLAIEVQAAAQKRANAEAAAAKRIETAAEKAALKQAMEAQRAAEKAAAAAERSAARRAAAEQKAAQMADRAAQKAAAAEEAAASRRRAIHESMWKNMLAAAGNASNAITRKVAGITNGFGKVGKAANYLGSRFRRILTSALIFNGVSALLRNVTSRFWETVSSVDAMEEALANLRGAAATAAAPIVEILTPALVKLTNAAATAFSYLGRIVSSITGKSLSDMAKMAKSAADTSKQVKGSLAGFDEIEKTGDSSDSDTQYNYDYSGTSDFLDSVLATVRQGQWKQFGAIIAQKLNESLVAIPWPSIQQKAQIWTQNLVNTINGFAEKLDWALLGSSVGNGLDTVLTVIDTFVQGTDWVTIGAGLGASLTSLLDAIDWELLGRTLTDRIKVLLELLHGFVSNFDFSGLGTHLAEATMSAINNVDWAQGAADLGTAAIGLLDMLGAWIAGIEWYQIGNGIAECIAAVDWSGLVSSLANGIGAALGGLGTLLWGFIEDGINSMMADFVKYTELCGGNAIAGLLTGMLMGLANIGVWIWDNVFVPIWEGICSAFDIHSPSRKMEKIGEYIIAGLLNGLISTWTEITDFFADLGDAIISIWEDGIIPAIKGPVNSIIGCINGMISGIVTGINTVIEALNKLSFDIPDWIPGIGGETFGFNIGTITAPQIPMLANGGVITQPTLGMMGEYPGANSNPEIVAPQSIMEETVANVMRDIMEQNRQSLETAIEILRDILEAVLGIQLTDDVIGRAVARYNAKMATIRGGSA